MPVRVADETGVGGVIKVTYDPRSPAGNTPDLGLMLGEPLWQYGWVVVGALLAFGRLALLALAAALKSLMRKEVICAQFQIPGPNPGPEIEG